ncbi:MAG TPA: TolC family protein [Verrucomicrobiae bacterium]|nr:TolC family protein [Verrucomicrobiae bacterium]
MKPAAFVLGLILAAFTPAAQAQQRVTTRPLALEECIQIALEHNLDIQISRLDPQLAGFSLAGSYASYDPIFNASAWHDYSLTAASRDDQNRVFLGSETDTDNVNSGLNGLLPWGFTYNLGTLMRSSDGLQGTNSFANAFDSIGISMRQPLLKNFWIDSTRLQIFTAKKNLKISEAGLRNQIITTVTQVEEAYYNLIFQNENVKVQEKALELAERLVAENRRRVEVGALAPLDEKQAESQAATSRANLLDAQANRDTAERVLKALLSDDYNVWMDVRIEPTEPLLAIPQTLDLQSGWRRGLELRPDLQQARYQIEIQTKRIAYGRNQLFPQLDLFGDYGYTGSTPFEDGLGAPLPQITDRDNPNYTYGVSISLPLANTGARNSLKAAKVTKEQLDLQLRQLEQRALITIENSMSDARIGYERIGVTRQATQYAEAALQAEQTKLEKGKSTTFVVLQLQTDLTQARSAEIRALADYNIFLARLAQNEGTTLERRKIDLQFK